MTRVPPDGAALGNRTVPVAGVPPVTLVGLTVNEESVAGGGAVADGVTVRSANCVTPPPVTEILTTVVADTAAGRIMMKPLVLPAGTTTPFDSVGRTAALLLVTRSTWSKPAVVAMVTVPLTEPCPPTAVAGESVRDVGAGPGTTVTCDCTVAPFHVAVSVAAVLCVTSFVGMPIETQQTPGGIVTVGDGLTAGDVLSRLTTAPLAGACPLSERIAPAVAPPLTGDPEIVNDFRDGGLTVTWREAETPFSVAVIVTVVGVVTCPTAI